jgi:hypothetical protein
MCATRGDGDGFLPRMNTDKHGWKGSYGNGFSGVADDVVGPFWSLP